jgi:mannan endo-1,4-beta-mannosidase
MHRLWLVLLLVGCQAPPESFPLTPVAPRCSADPAFVQVCQGRFTLQGKRFVVVGANAYYLMEEAARELSAAGVSDTVEEVMGELAGLGATVVRTWAFNDEPDAPHALQPGPLQPGENGLRGLDHVIARAEAHGLRLVLPLVNYWPEYGGVDQYLRWHGLAVGRPEDRGAFFVDPEVRAHFRRHIVALMGRINTETGRRYADEPAVLAWELMNEGRGLGASAWWVASWVQEMAGALRAAGARQLIGTGESGYDDVERCTDACATFVDAVGEWPVDGSQGTSCALNSALVDYASVHCYPEAWGARREQSEQACSSWVRWHHQLATAAGRPLLWGEAGLVNQELFSEGLHPLTERRAIYRAWLGQVESGEAAGLLLWLYIPDRRPESWDRFSFGLWAGSQPGDPRNRYTDLLLEHGKRLRAQP